MLKKSLLMCVCVGCWMTMSAQTSLEVLKTRYEADKRNFVVVKEYAAALENARLEKEAEIVVREYMARCPVLQVEDKDTYLFINRYVFDNPYSEVFGHAIYAWKKMKWGRVEKETVNGREIMLMGLLKGMSKGVSGGDEIDKRYEVLSVLSKNLHKEIDKLCTPRYVGGKYVMPELDAEKVKRLEYQLERGDLLGSLEMRLKIKIAKAWGYRAWDNLLKIIREAVDLGIEGLGGDYAFKMLTCLGDKNLSQEQIKQGLELVLNLCENEEKIHGGINFYKLVGEWYRLAGDAEYAEEFIRRSDEMEAEKMEKYGDMLKIFQEKQ